MVHTHPIHEEFELEVTRKLRADGSVLLEATLQAIFQSTPFRSSRQCQDLLRYIVTHTVAGDDLLLRERVIGMEVFGRKPDYDTGQDPVVRLRASDLRKRLAQFYQSGAGHAAEIQITIPSGSYRASFEWQSPAAAPSPPAESEPSPPLQAEPTPVSPAFSAGPQVTQPNTTSQVSAVPRRRLAVTGVATVALLACCIAVLLYWRGHKSSAMDEFWTPLLNDAHPALICLGSNAVYRLSNDFLDEYQKKTGQTHEGMEFLIDPVPGEKLDQRDLLRANNSFVALGDVAAASDFVSLFAQRGKRFSERFPPDMSFAEVQEYSSVLVGGFNNQMALTITKDLPLVLKGSDRVQDRANPERTWHVQFYGDARDSEDYALISRLLDPATGRETVTLGGIGQYGTQAAADFLTDPASMEALAASLPKGWARKSLQVVLYVKVIDYRPVKRQVVATRVW